MIAPNLKQQTALFFIFLLAGHEVAQASRLHKTRRASLTRWTGPEAVSAWEQENEVCKTTMGFWCKDGKTDPSDESISQCAKTTLLGKCQLTDEWMLGSYERPVTWYLRVQAKVLTQKVEDFSSTCGKGKSLLSCRQQIGSIFRAVKLISKASIGTKIQPSKMAWFAPEEQQEVKGAVDAARDRLATIAFGEGDSADVKRQLLKRLQDALTATQATPMQQSNGPVLQLIQVLQDLLTDGKDPSEIEAEISEIEKNGLKRTQPQKINAGSDESDDVLGSQVDDAHSAEVEDAQEEPTDTDLEGDEAEDESAELSEMLDKVEMDGFMDSLLSLGKEPESQDPLAANPADTTTKPDSQDGGLDEAELMDTDPDSENVQSRLLRPDDSQDEVASEEQSKTKSSSTTWRRTKLASTRYIEENLEKKRFQRAFLSGPDRFGPFKLDPDQIGKLSLIEVGTSDRQMTQTSTNVVARVLIVIFVFMVLSVTFLSLAGPLAWAIILAVVCAMKEDTSERILPCMGEYFMRPINWLYKETTDLVEGN